MSDFLQLAECPNGLQALCQTVAGIAPLPMAAVFGQHHQICFANHAFTTLVGQPETSLLGKPFSAATRLSGECSDDLDRVYKTGQVQSRNGQSELDPSLAFVSYIMWPVVDDGDPPMGIMIQITESGTFRQQSRDVNEALLLSSVRQHEATGLLNEKLRVEANERDMALAALMKSEKMASVGRMTAAMAHEINNPLEAVTNTLYLARITPDLPESARQFLDMADGELHRIAHITRQTLGYYRESSGTERFSIDSLIDSVFHLLRSKVQSKQAKVTSVSDKNLFMTAHFGELRQVVSNLVLNSLDAIESGGSVRIRASLHTESDTARNGAEDHAGKRIRISIADNGPGISAHALPQIFDPFFTTKGSIGNGLGLWVTRELVAKHQGSIRVRSSKRGIHKGTTFSITLPQSAVQSAAAN